MANVRISNLTAVTASSDDDLLVIVDDPGGTPDTNKITVENFLLRAWGQIKSTGGTQSLTAAGGWTLLTQWTTNTGIARNATEDQANDRITVDNAGIYRVYVLVEWTNDVSVTTEFAVYWNGAITEAVWPGTAGTAGVERFEGLVDVTTGATNFELYARVSADADVDLTSALMYVHCLGDT